MHNVSDQSGSLAAEFAAFLKSPAFPCVGAKSALALSRLQSIEAGSIASDADDVVIYDRIAAFTADGRNETSAFRSLAILFRDQVVEDEDAFVAAFWRRLQALHNIDVARGVGWAENVSADVSSAKFSMSLAGAGYFVIGLHPASPRLARRFSHPAMIFNPHDQFESLRADGRYGRIQEVVRTRELRTQGTLNPMLAEFGRASEAAQYSGQETGPDWICPLKVNQ
jgi:uncharacterized protein